MAEAQASRIFIRNLPPNLTESDFRAHFSAGPSLSSKSSKASKFQPIDTLLIASRRIGYVGFTTAKEAAEAVKYFDRNFIRLSRIRVEIAKPASELKPKRQNNEDHKRGKHEASKYVPKQAKASADEQKPDEQNPKLKEFLSAMQPAGNTKRVWDNDDEGFIAPGDKAPPDVNVSEDTLRQTEGASDDEYESVPKKRRKLEGLGQERSESRKDGNSLENDSATVPFEKPPPDNQLEIGEIADATLEGRTAAAIREPDDDQNWAVKGQSLPDGNNENKNANPPPASDLDWLRSKTSRTLDLLNDEEIDDHGIPTPSVDSARKPNNLQGKTHSSDAGSQALNLAQTQSEVANRTVGEKGPAARHESQQDDEELVDAPDETAAGHAEQGRSEPPTSRLFVRNLSYQASEQDILEQFKPFGTIREIHIPKDNWTGSTKGYAYVEFEDSSSANNALEALDGRSLLGRLLHILPSAAKRTSAAALKDAAIAHLPHKKQLQIKRKRDATTATFSWNSLYMNPDAALASVADRLGVSKSQLLDPTSADAAVKQAHAETNVIQETKQYFASQGVNIDAFQKHERSDTAILVKNFSYGTTSGELKSLFEAHGQVVRLLMPPAGTLAIVEMRDPQETKTAYRALAYSRLRDSMLFLEKAPKAVFEGAPPPVAVLPTSTAADLAAGVARPSVSDLLAGEDAQPGSSGTSATLFVKNLNFETTTERLTDLFRPLTGFVSALVKTKTDPKKPGQTLSMGFGFVEFSSTENAAAAAKALTGFKLDGHELSIRASHKGADAAAQRRAEDRAKREANKRTKLVVKNLPFEASKKDVRALLAPYGALRSVRVPRKMDNGSRGFAFADFHTPKEAENALVALRGTHLLGRRLAIDFASEEPQDAEEEIERMAAKVGRQAEGIRVRNLVKGGERKKFTVDRGDEDVD